MNICDKMSELYEEQINLLISELRYVEIQRHDIYEIEQQTHNNLKAINAKFAGTEYDLLLEKLREITKARCEEHRRLYKNFEHLVQSYRKSIVVLYNEIGKLQYTQNLANDQSSAISANYKDIC